MPDNAAVLRCLLPVGLDLDALCASSAAGAQWPVKHRHKLAYIVHTVLRGYQHQHATAQDDTNRGIPLNVALLQTLLGKGTRDFAKEAIEALMDWRVLIRSANHYAGTCSRRYRLTPQFEMAPVQWQIFQAPRLVSKLRDRRRRETARDMAVDPAFAFVADNLAAVTLGASGHAEAAKQLRAFTDPRRQAAWLLSLDDLMEPAAHFSHSDKTGRIYHGVANCPAELRQHLLIDGEPVVEVDMSAAQFFLLLDMYPAPSAERSRYAATVGSGFFYEHLFKLLSARGEGAPWGDGSALLAQVWREDGGDILRRAFKKHALRKLLYERLYPSTRAAGLWPVFAAEFPALAEVVASRRGSRVATSVFCCEMQRREARLVLGQVIPRIRSELPGCKPVSIHDGVMCQARFSSAVRDIVIEEAQALYGAAPFVKVKAGAGASCLGV